MRGWWREKHTGDRSGWRTGLVVRMTKYGVVHEPLSLLEYSSGSGAFRRNKQMSVLVKQRKSRDTAV